MDEISRFFKGLYYQFLLRDVAGKVIPGLLILMAMIVFLTGDSAPWAVITGFFGAASSITVTIVFFGLGLMLGMLLQFIGNRTYTFGKRNVNWGPKTLTVRGKSFKLPKIKFSLPAVDWTPIVIHVWGSEEETMKKELNFRHYANLDTTGHVRMKRERLVILKEMAGTYAVAFSLAFIILLVTWIISWFDDIDNLTIESIIFFAVLWVVVMVLSRQNKALAEEQRSWEKLVIDSKGKPPATSAASAAKPATRARKS